MEKEEGNESDTTPRVETTIETWKRLEAIDAKKEEEEYLALAEARNLFDVDELLETAIKPRKLSLPELGEESFHVFWCPLNSVDRVDIMRIEDKNSDVQIDLRNRRAVYIMLSKADSRCTEAMIRRMPAYWIDVILTKVSAEQRSFLSPLVRSVLSGLRPTSRPRRRL